MRLSVAYHAGMDLSCRTSAPWWCWAQVEKAAWEQEREQLLDQIHRFRISAEGLEVAVVRERKEKEVCMGR